MFESLRAIPLLKNSRVLGIWRYLAYPPFKGSGFFQRGQSSYFGGLEVCIIKNKT